MVTVFILTAKLVVFSIECATTLAMGRFLVGFQPRGQVRSDFRRAVQLIQDLFPQGTEIAAAIMSSVDTAKEGVAVNVDEHGRATPSISG